MRKECTAVREAFKKEQQRALAYANRKRANYEFKVGQDVLISRRRHYKGLFKAGKGPLAPRAVGPFTIMRKADADDIRIGHSEGGQGQGTPCLSLQ
jgi:hypothetical protein